MSSLIQLLTMKICLLYTNADRTPSQSANCTKPTDRLFSLSLMSASQLERTVAVDTGFV
jgi:hypothetical protein